MALSLVRGIGGVTLRELVNTFGDAEAVLNADDTALRAVRGVGPKISAAIQDIDLDRTQADMDRWQQAGVAILTLHDLTYPMTLANIPDPPPTLFLRGNWTNTPRPFVAVVGTRTPSPRAIEQAEQIGYILTTLNAVIVSGVAVGVDTEAHRGTLRLPNGYTIGVLGSGVLNPYPPENLELSQTICQHGVLMCEVAPDAVVSTPGLVARNRITSGLCRSVIIVETAEDGGAMHAARAAYRQGRPLFAIDNKATGNRKLIENGWATPLSPELSNLRLVLG